MIIVAGIFGLMSGKKIKEKFVSVTEEYRKFYKNNICNKIYKIISIFCLLGGIFIWVISDRNILWTILCLLTILWFWRVKKMPVLASLSFLAAMSLAYFNLNAGLVWLLTVIAMGYFEFQTKNTIEFDKLPNLTAVSTKSEGLINCPVDQEVMNLYKITDGEETVMFDKCLKCQAIFFDEENHVWPILKSQISNPKNKIGKYLCPRCQIMMKKKQEYLQCPRCLGNLMVLE